LLPGTRLIAKKRSRCADGRLHSRNAPPGKPGGVFILPIDSAIISA
jgi:hypothetical protein